MHALLNKYIWILTRIVNYYNWTINTNLQLMINTKLYIKILKYKIMPKPTKKFTNLMKYDDYLAKLFFLYKKYDLLN